MQADRSCLRGAARVGRPSLSEAVLPKSRRLRRRDDIASVLRGRRVGTPRLVVHYESHGVESGRQPARLGLAVGRRVGNSVSRHRIARRVRHVFAQNVQAWDELACDVVVRVLPGGATASSAEVATDLDKARRTIGGAMMTRSKVVR